MKHDVLAYVCSKVQYFLLLRSAKIMVILTTQQWTDCGQQ